MILLDLVLHSPHPVKACYPKDPAIVKLSFLRAVLRMEVCGTSICSSYATPRLDNMDATASIRELLNAGVVFASLNKVETDYAVPHSTPVSPCFLVEAAKPKFEHERPL